MTRAVYISTLVALSFLVASVPSAQSKTALVYLNVVNQAGEPVPDLGVTDVQIKEGGTPQTITKIGPSIHPMRIALLLDTSSGFQFQIKDVRAALDAFVDAVPAPHEMLFVTTGTQVRVRVQPTADRKKMKDSSRGLFIETSGGGTLLFDAITEVDNRFVKKADGLTPVFVIVSGDGSETSQRYDEKVFNQFTQSLAQRNVPVHSIVLSRGTSKAPLLMARHLSQTTRGYSDVIGVSTELPDILKGLATNIVEADRKAATWYEVEYVSTSKEPQPLEISISRPGVFRAQSSATRPIR